MTNRPFEAMQDMYLFDPMTGLPRLEANPKLLEVALRRRSEKEMLDKLKLLNIKLVDREPDWGYCCSVNWESGDLVKENLDMILNLLASNLVYKCQSPIEIVQYEKSIIVRTGI